MGTLQMDGIAVSGRAPLHPEAQKHKATQRQLKPRHGCHNCSEGRLHGYACFLDKRHGAIPAWL